MRVLVVGSLPPPLSERARGLLAEVVRLRSEGNEVEILSPRANTVAHRHIAAPGAAAALEVALAARGSDEVVLQLEPGFPFAASAGRAGRAVGLGALATALKSCGLPVTLRLHSVHDLPGGPGGRAAEGLWALARRIEVGGEETLESLQAVLSPETAAKLALGLPPLQLGSGRRPETALVGGANLEDATALVRARSAADRSLITRGRGEGVAELPLGEWLPSPGAGVPFPGELQRQPRPSTPLARRAGRAVLHAADSASLTRPLARGLRVARTLARRY